MGWTADQKWEADWWGPCTRTYGEETKQLHYASLMGIPFSEDSQGPFIDVHGKTIIDVGGGPVSMLLKCKNLKAGIVIDPCQYPKWVAERYKAAGILYVQMPAEQMLEGKPNDFAADEVWLYNVLQHVENPEKIVKNCLISGKIVRVFDWLEVGVAPGHPQNLTQELMDKWFEGEGHISHSNGGKEYSGVFKGRSYTE